MKNYISTDKIGSEHVTVSRRSMFSGLAIGCALFLSACGGSEPTTPTETTPADTEVSISTLELEKTDLKFGFIKLTDMAPLAIAYEKGYFEDEGLFVTLEPQANWKVLLDRVIDGELDGAHMLAGQPLAATIGFGTEAHVITPFSMDLNGNGITVSNEIWEAMKVHVPIGDDGKPVHPIKADYGNKRATITNIKRVCHQTSPKQLGLIWG